MQMIDITGQRFGRLTVIGMTGGRGSRGEILWLCKCDCGNETVLSGTRIRSRHGTRSCGCLSKEICIERSTTHGETHSRLYCIWRGMKARCTNPKATGYKNYGGRGITICDEWLHNFEAFRDWALGNGYAEGLTIDRVNNDNGYSPNNCRWATIAEQNKNRRCVKARATA